MRLRAAEEEHAGAVGCGELARHLLANGLVDEVRFWLPPRYGGEGTRPYQGETVRMRFLGSTPFDSGVTLLRFEPLETAR
jgi:dihydrofolate reductase